MGESIKDPKVVNLGSAEESVIISSPRFPDREINFPPNTEEPDKILRRRFKPDVTVTYRGISGRVVDPWLSANDITAWWAIPVVLDGDNGYIHYLNYKTLTITGGEKLEPEVIEAREEYREAGIYRDKRTGKIWANTSMDHERFYCLNDSFTWPLFGPMDHWTPLYEKVWNAA